MPEVAVSRKTSELQPLAQQRDIFQPIAPLGRFFSLNPFAMMREFAGEMDRLMHGDGGGTDTQVWAPAVDVERIDGSLAIAAELPGVKKDELKVEVTDDTLTIRGERKQEHREDQGGYHLWERHYGRFYRAIPLPDGAKSDQVKAELKDGILKVSVPVPEVAKKTRQVPIAG